MNDIHTLMAFNTQKRSKVYNLHVVAASTAEDNTINFNGVATYTKLIHTGGGDVQVKLDDAETNFTLEDETTQTFDDGSLHLRSIAFDNTASGSTDAWITVIAGVVE